MSEEMAVGDITTPVEAKLNGDEAVASAVEGEGTSSKRPDEPPALETMETTPPDEDVPVPEIKTEAEEPDIKPVIEASDIKPDIEASDKKPDIQVLNIKAELDVPETTEYRGTKRRASAAFSDNGEEFRGFDDEAAVEEDFRGFDIVDEKDLSVDYSRVLERLEAEVSAAVASFTPLRSVMATPPVPPRAAKRPRKDTDGSRPSSALSSRSEDAVSVEGLSTASSPASRGRRATTEISSPLLRVPLERGWKRELVYRAALDSHSRRNADIYYYTPQGKKLRSTREVSEQLPGTGLTLDNFSFFKEPLGVDDPEREIIRDAKMMRRVESPVSAPAPIAAEGKRTPKPKAPKGASPEHATPKSPPIKIRVKSVGSRLSNSAPAPAPPAAPAAKQRKPAGDNNNSAAWKKPKQPPHAAAPAPGTPPLQPVPPPQPPPLQSRPQQQTTTDVKSPRQAVQPCSLTCGRGVPSLACGACLCLYHPHCAGYQPATHTTFFCKNCRTSPSAPSEPPPLIHKSGVPAASVGAAVATPVARRAAPATHTRSDKRVLLRMKVAGGGPDGERLWAVAKPQPTGPKPQPVSVPIPVPVPIPRPRPVAAVPAAPRPLSVRGALPQTIAILNGRRFIVVPKNMVQPSAQHEARTRGRLANGASSPPELLSPRRRGRTRQDDTDYFTAFYNKAHEKSYNVVTQIFQYLGMRDLAMCARVCRLWRQLAATPALWRHVRMKNSHVSDWGGLCSALKRHGTKRLDLRKMLLPQNDAVFWEQFAEHIATVDTLERIEMCRCPASAVESVCRGLPSLRALSALAIRDALLDPSPLGALPLLHELRLKSMSGLSLTRDLMPLAALTHLQHLSLTSIKELGWSASEVVGRLEQLESLELGECTFRAEFAQVLGRLTRLRRLRLERGTAHCAAPALLRALATLPLLARLELVNIDVKVGFDDALAECRNIQRLLIIPTYVSQSATTNKQVLSGVLRLKDTLTHLMWGVTIELLRVTELFIDQCEQAGEAPRRDVGECIPVLKPVPGCRLPLEHRHVGSPPQVEILPLPTLQRLLSAQLPNTKLKLLRIPFHATWRQSLADFQ